MGKEHVRLGVDLEGVRSLKGFLAFTDDDIIAEVKNRFKRDNVTKEHVQLYFLTQKKYAKQENANIKFSNDEKNILSQIKLNKPNEIRNFEKGLNNIALKGLNNLIADQNDKTEQQKIGELLKSEAEKNDNDLKQDLELDKELEELDRQINQDENQKVNQVNINNEDPYAEQKKEIKDLAKTISDTLNKHKLSKYGVEVARIAKLSAEADTEENLKKFKDGLDKYKNVLDPIDAAWNKNTGAKTDDTKKLQEEAKKLATEINTYLSSKVNSNNDAIRENQKNQENWEVIDVAEKNKIIAEFNADNNFFKRIEEKAAKKKAAKEKAAKEKAAKQKAKNNDLKAEINKIEEPVKEEKEMPGKNNEKDPKKEAYKVDPNNIIAVQNEVQINAVPKPVVKQNVEKVEQKVEQQPEVKPAEAPKHEVQNEISKANEMQIDAEKKPEAEPKVESKPEKEVDPAKLEQVINNYEKAQNDFANKNNIIAAEHLLKNKPKLSEEDMDELQDAYDKQSESEKELRAFLPERLDADNHISIPDLIKNQMRLEEGRLSPQEKMEHYQNILNLKDQDGDKYSKQLMDYRQKIAKEAGKEFDKKHQDPAKLSFLNKSANAIEKVMCAMCKNPLGIGILLVAAINFPMMIIGLLAFTAWKRKRPDPAYQRAWKEQNQRELEAKRQQMAKTYNCDPSELSDREVTKALKSDYVNDKVMEALDEKLEKDSKKLVDKTTKNYAKEISKESGEKFRARDLKNLARKEINPRRGLLDLDTNREARLRDNINKKERGLSV